MYEAKYQPLIPRTRFYRRIMLHIVAVLVLLITSLIIGILGYCLTEKMSAIDAFLNTAMLLGGMGPVNPLNTFCGKLFAGIFALYAGLVFIVCAALVFTPVMHRILHHFHLNEKA